MRSRAAPRRAVGRNDTPNFFGLCVYHFRCRARARSVKIEKIKICKNQKSQNCKIEKFAIVKFQKLKAAKEFLQICRLRSCRREGEALGTFGRLDHDAISNSMSAIVSTVKRPPQ
jgi:hypothetical protein